MRPLLIITLLIASFSLSFAETKYQLYDPRPLANTTAISVDDDFVALLKPVPHLLEYDKKTLKEVIEILESYYKKDYSEKIRVKKINVKFANLIRIGELGDNFYKDGIFVYYCTSTLNYDTDKKKGGIADNTVLVTLDGKVIPRFNQIPTKISRK